MRWMSYWETRLCPANDHCLPGWPETGFEEVNGDLREADFWTTSSESALDVTFRLARHSGAA
jgi:hypothetical protein